jgi:hypothetical protein
MYVIRNAYPTETAARRAADVLRRSGVPAQAIRLLVGSPLHDVRNEPAGRFAGEVGPNAPVGTFASTTRLRRQGAGAFAGDPDRQRRGSFADSDRVVIVAGENGAEHARVTGHHELERFLRDAALDDDAIKRVLDELDAGHVVMLIQAQEPRAHAA